MPRLLLHACCAPCVVYPIERLEPEFELGVFFYNPNIQPAEEYDKRLSELIRFCQKQNMVLIERPYDTAEWFDKIKGLENEPERGRRCDICYEMRLRKTAEYAKKNGFAWFGTGLTSSPYKKADKINELGQQLEKELGVKYYAADFKKKGGALRAVELSKKYGFYRQNYCGCVFSKRERETKDAKRREALRLL